MADRPIIFSAPMVRALLDGRKTQTRRVLKPQPSGIKSARSFGPGWAIAPESNRCTVEFKAPAFASGDRLYVREAFNAFQFSQDGDEAWPVKIPTLEECKEAEELAHRYGAPQIVYRESDRAREWFADQKWRPSIHMPRWASRLTLTVTEVRVQRLKEISEADARAEGASWRLGCSGFLGKDAGWSMDWSRVGEMSAFAHRKPGGPAKAPLTEKDISLPDAQMAFASYWNSLNGPDAWDENPWVVAYSFTVQRGNIDQIGKA